MTTVSLSKLSTFSCKTHSELDIRSRVTYIKGLTPPTHLIMPSTKLGQTFKRSHLFLKNLLVWVLAICVLALD